MEFIGGIKNKVKLQLNETNFSGAIDIVVIQNESNTLASTPFYCKFGNLGIKNATMKTVKIKINDILTSKFSMVFLENGDAYYVEESFKIIRVVTDEPKLNEYLEAAKALEVALMNKPAMNNETKPSFYIEYLDDESDDTTSLISQEIPIVDLNSKVKNNSLLFDLNSDQLKCFCLNQGHNEISYSVETSQGVKTIYANIYLWPDTTKIVVSDLDGTITKSDVLGQVLPRLGRDWSHNDVAELYHKIYNNEYKFIYLTARSICISDSTRNLIENIKQNKFFLPKGPLLLNPSKIIDALSAEVIYKKSDEFKISCLNNLKSLFKENPFHAGFGNTEKDLISYKTVGIDPDAIFIINQNGIINNDLSLSYKELTNCVHLKFPNKILN